jgi:hypothetical protein
MDRKIIIDGGLVPVARVKNQNLLDTLLDLELIEVREHLAGEYVAEQCVKAGIHIKAVNFDGMPLGGGNPKNSFNGLMPLRKTLRLVIKKCGSKGADVLVDAVASDLLQATNLNLLRQTLITVSDHRLSVNGHFRP